MKATHKTQRFDYNKIEQKDDPREYWEYYGFHPKHGRIHVDTKRFKKIMTQDGTTEFFYDGMFKNRTTTYLIPAKIHRYDYKVNIMRDLLSSLQNDWDEEYKPLLSKVQSPNDVYENTRLNSIAMTSCADDLDDIEVESRMAAFRRERQYQIILQSLYCQFISKICTEIDRFTLIFIKELGYSQKDFGMRDFRAFTDGLKGEKRADLLSTLKGYNAYNLLHKINNFLKHNTIDAYNGLKKEYPRNVCSVENKTAKKPYENGMFAGDWIIVKEGYIDNLFKKLKEFFEDYCNKFLNEDLEESKWNYDDYFKDVVKEVKDLREYFGLYF